MKRKKPKFVRIDQWRYKRIEDSGWRNQRTLDNKIRRKLKGWPKPVEAGYRKPAAVRGLHPSGFVEVLVHNPKELEGLDPKTHAARVAATVGRKKRLEIIKRAKELGIYVLNARE
ncbi:MAG: 50S ribosomal protein L32e [Pyrobaculum sp.]